MQEVSREGSSKGLKCLAGGGGMGKEKVKILLDLGKKKRKAAWRGKGRSVAYV